MKIYITCLGSIKKYVTDETFSIEVEDGATVADAIQKVIVEQPGIQKIIKHAFVSVNENLVSRNSQVSDQDRIALFTRPGGG